MVSGLLLGVPLGLLRLQAAQTLATSIGVGTPRRFTHRLCSQRPPRTLFKETWGSTDASSYTAFPIGGRDGCMTMPSASTPILASG